MAGFIPDEIIEDVRTRADCVEIISEHVRLIKTGENFKGLCPFHQEKTPSFTVSPKKGVFHCFGCGAGGNVITFIMKIEGKSFVEAVEFLAKREGILLPSSQSVKQVDIKEIFYNINQDAVEFYKKILYSNEGNQALAYLKKRGLTDETINKFKLGYAPDAWQRLRDYLSGKNYPIEKQLASGLIIQKQGDMGSGSHYYDRFRNRIIFPIFELQSRVVGFGARVLDNSLPKYINSPETIIYSKGKLLYGLNLAKDSIRKKTEVIIVEGYLDVIMSHQYGFDNVVATLGTAFTLEQVKLLKRYAERVIVIFDPDMAGVSATSRGLDLVMEQGLEIKIVSLPDGLDPAEFLVKRDKLEFSDLLEKAEGWLDYRFNLAISKFNPASAGQTIQVFNELLPTIGKITNKIERQPFIKRISEFLKIDEQLVIEELNKNQSKQPYFKLEEHIKQQEEKFVKAEKGLIRFLLEGDSDDLSKEIISQLSENDFLNPQCQEIFKAIIELIQNEKTMSFLMHGGLKHSKVIDKISNEAGQLVSMLTFQKIETEAEDSRVIKDYIQCLKIRSLNQRKHQIQKLLAQSPDNIQLTKEYGELEQQVRRLK